MTKKELKWRLKNLPTINELETLVANSIITKEEARKLLFNEQEPRKESDENMALKKQIEFLEGLVKELSKQQHISTIPVYLNRYVEMYRPFYGSTWTSGGSVTGISTPSTNTSIANYTSNLLKSTN